MKYQLYMMFGIILGRRALKLKNNFFKKKIIFKFCLKVHLTIFRVKKLKKISLEFFFKIYLFFIFLSKE
jgi:hypothetical protein